MAASWSVGALLRRVRRRRAARGAVLVYHRVAHTRSDPFGQAVNPTTFERQLRLARRYGTIIRATDLVERLARGDAVDRALVVTFDDGYADNLTVAAPIAAALGVPITVFIAVQPVFDGAPFWWDELGAAVLEGGPPSGGRIALGDGPALPLGSPAERAEAMQQLHATLRRASAPRRAALIGEVVRQLPLRETFDAGAPMTVAELRRLASLPGVDIGAHTMTHPSLAALAPAEQRSEMSESRITLEQLLGTPVRLLAYPFGKPGDVSDTTRALAEAAGFDAAFTTVPLPVEPRADRFAIPRLTMHAWPDEMFAAKLEALVGPPDRE